MIECFWYILASVLAGVGTGLVGLSAATVMVPILIVLCPSFAGETGAYQATAIALASVSHILIHPAILLKRWPVLVLCMTVATAASLASARFANRVDSRTVGLVTGVVLTLLGAALILLHYWEYIKAVPLLYGVLGCTLEFLEYIVPAAVILLGLHHFFKIPSHVFRKLLHLAAFTCLVEMMWAAEEWYQASLTALLFAAAVYPILCALEGQPWFAGLFVQKGPGEVKKSLLLLFIMDAALVAVCWGGFGLPWAAAVSILMWGTGDGAAALAGHRFGKHHVKLPLADPKKTWEGSAAMVGVSTLVGTASMLVMTSMSWWQCLLFALAAAIPGAYTELISRGGNDTVTVPVVNTAVLLALHFVSAG